MAAKARYSIAILAVAFAVAIGTSLIPLWGQTFAFTTFYPAVVISTWYGGLWPGLLATALSTLSSAYFLLPPVGSLKVESWGDRLGLIFFILVQLLITFLTESLRRARFRAEEAQQKVIEASEHFRRIVETANEGIWQVDAAWRTTYVNSRLAQMLGYSVDEMLGRHPLDFAFEEDRALMGEKIAEGRQGRAVSGELRLRRKDSSELWIQANATPILDERGEHAGAFSMVTDVSARKRAESRLRLLSEASLTLASSLDFKTTLQNLMRVVVPAAADLCVVDLVDEDGLFKRVAAYHHDPKKAEFVDALERYGPARDPSLGVPKTFLEMGEPLLYVEMTDEMFQASAHDPTHLKLLRRLGGKSSIIVPLTTARFDKLRLVVDSGGGSSPPADDKAKFVEPRRLVGALTLTVTEAGRRYDESDLAFAGELGRRAANAIESARLFAAVQEASRRKDEFLAMLGHELRNPIAAMLNAHRAASAKHDAATVAQAHEILDRQIRHMSRLVDDLLDVSRITRGKVLLKREPVDLARLVRETCADLHEMVETSGLGFELDFEAGLPGLWVDGDRTRLAQMLTNLISNAVKFTNEGGRVTVGLRVADCGMKKSGRVGEWESGRAGEREVEESAISDPQSAILTVRDTGIGIEPGMLPRVFDTFTQADRTLDRSRGGLGLGLALVKGLAEAHGGAVEAHSGGIGHGSTFTLRLPLIAAPAKTASLTAKAQPGAGSRLSQGWPNDPSPPTGAPLTAAWPTALTEIEASAAAPVAAPGPLRVLVIDDNQDSADMSCLMLQIFGYTTEAVYSARKGIELVERTQPDAVCCDIGLPEMDGYEVARELRRRGYRGLLIAVSGYGQEEDKRLSREAGFDAHLVKPVEPEDLHQALKDLRQLV
jgi:PAS domain S-box-containing protein